MLPVIRSCLPVIRQGVLSENLPRLSPQLQFVRWRKRRWSPINRSKLFYVRKPTPIDPEEWQELHKRTGIYNTHMKAITKYFKASLKHEEQVATSTSVAQEEEDDFQQLLLINDQWNADTAKIREANQARWDSLAEEKRLNKLIEVERQQELQKQTAEQLVQQELEQSKHFINVDDLEGEIERALNMRVNYRFAIDLSGNRYIEQPDGSTDVAKDCESSQVFQTPEQSTETDAEVKQ